MERELYGSGGGFKKKKSSYFVWEGAFFHFKIKVPNNYPEEEPLVYSQNTNDGKVSFSPLIQKTGEVSLFKWADGGEPYTNHSIKDICHNLIEILSDQNPIQLADGFEEIVPVEVEALFYNKYLTYCTWKYVIFGYLNKDYTGLLTKNTKGALVEHKVKVNLGIFV